MIRNLRKKLVERFHDREYRHGYLESFLDHRIAAQIRLLREERGWTQAELAERAGTGQSRISSMEQIDYSRWSISTLKKLARVFDVALVVKFDSFGHALDDLTTFHPPAVKVPSYEQDPGMTEDRSVELSTQTGTAMKPAGVQVGSGALSVAWADSAQDSSDRALRSA